MGRKKTPQRTESVIIITALFAVLLLLFGLGWGFGMHGMFFFGPAFMVLVLFLIVWMIAVIVRDSGR